MSFETVSATQDDWSNFVSKHWLIGTTCFARKGHSVVVVTPDCQWALIKHEGHMESMGRWQSPERCKTYYALYHASVLGERDAYGDKAVKTWVGRYTNAVKMAVCEEIKRHSPGASEKGVGSGV